MSEANNDDLPEFLAHAGQAELCRRLEAMYHDVFAREEACRDYFAEDYRQCTDGVWSDRDMFVEHLKHVRERAGEIAFTVREAVCAGGMLADRHEVRVRTREGSQAHFEVMVMACLEKGRIARLIEQTRLCGGDERLSGLGSELKNPDR
ncbi:nuclear transport factor 2 family protein [Paludibacterium paludis]|uniref:SnoaL-like domain-containing protein n=1 Tax=Paludibacterium paludis TaxID=1225769 RepID=A0A918P1V0_9NEIS|nr:nuclear transport factor 2 family protein [Paludibacterium paludis]GGY14107.1 hypothetical protein GCM10011289_16830 [Paludibacterium paludis]